MSADRPLIGCAWHGGADIDACGCPALDSPGAIAYRGLLVQASAEIARLTAERDAARLEVDCGQDGPCAKAPGCARHWQERNRELADDLAAARAVPPDVEAALAGPWANVDGVLAPIRRAGRTPHALKLTGGGVPGHPLYLRRDLTPFPVTIHG